MTTSNFSFYFTFEIAIVNRFEAAIQNVFFFSEQNFTFFNQKCVGNSDRAVYSDLKPLDGGQLLCPMSTVLSKETTTKFAQL